MKVWFSQIYIEPDVDFPFSHVFQKFLSEAVSSRVNVSDKYLKLYGSEFELMFRISAKRRIRDNQIFGPTVFKKTRDVEYTIFLPFAVINKMSDIKAGALSFLLKGVYQVLDSLEIDITALRAAEGSIVERVLTDPAMIMVDDD